MKDYDKTSERGDEELIVPERPKQQVEEHPIWDGATTVKTVSGQAKTRYVVRYTDSSGSAITTGTQHFVDLAVRDLMKTLAVSRRVVELVVSDASAAQSIQKWITNNRVKILDFKRQFGVSDNARKLSSTRHSGWEGGTTPTPWRCVSTHKDNVVFQNELPQVQEHRRGCQTIYRRPLQREFDILQKPKGQGSTC